MRPKTAFRRVQRSMPSAWARGERRMDCAPAWAGPGAGGTLWPQSSNVRERGPVLHRELTASDFDDAVLLDLLRIEDPLGRPSVTGGTSAPTSPPPQGPPAGRRFSSVRGVPRSERAAREVPRLAGLRLPAHGRPDHRRPRAAPGRRWPTGDRVRHPVVRGGRPRTYRRAAPPLCGSRLRRRRRADRTRRAGFRTGQSPPPVRTGAPSPHSRGRRPSQQTR